MTPDLVAAIGININPEIFGGAITWHGLFTAIGIALGVWLSLRIARRVGISEDDGMTIALVGVPSGIVGARLLWVLEHTDQIDNFGDIIAITDGGISVYGALIGGVLGAFLYVVFFRPQFPKWIALDVAAPGMILGQTIGRIGDFINGEHFASATNLPWAFLYTNPETDGPWASFVDGQYLDPWVRGESGSFTPAAVPVPVHPVAGGYEPLLDLLILGGILLLRRMRILPGWGFIFYVVSYAAVRGLLSLLRDDEQTIVGDLSVPQVLAIATAAAAAVMAWYLLRHPQPPLAEAGVAREERREEARRRRSGEDGGGEGERPSRPSGPQPRRRGGQVRIRKRRDRYRG